jgi:acid phosphatase
MLQEGLIANAAAIGAPAMPEISSCRVESRPDDNEARPRRAACLVFSCSHRALILGLTTLAIGASALYVFLPARYLSKPNPSVHSQVVLTGMPHWSTAEVHLGDINGEILSIGDWGCGGEIPDGCPAEGAKGQQRVAREMGMHAKSNPIDFVLNLGDSFYPTGVSSLEDEQWNSTFADVYTSEHLKVPWYGVLGNHDWVRNASALVTMQKRWRIPALGYTMKGRAKGVPFTFFMLDTNAVLRNDICARRNKSDWGPMPSEDVQICEEALAAAFHNQLEWLDQELYKAQGDLKIVVAHEPIYATGRWAFEANNLDTSLQESLDPLLHKHGVHTYISGHDHLFEHLSHKGIDYFISGAAGGESDCHGRHQPTIAKVNKVLPCTFGHSRITINQTDLCIMFNSDGMVKPNYKYCKSHGVHPQMAADA